MKPTLVNKIHIKIVDHEAINEIVNLHVHSMPRDVLSNLGRGTIIRYYHTVIQRQVDGDAYLFGAFEGERLIGFCCLTKYSVGLRSIIRMDTIAFIIILFFRDINIFFKGFVQLYYDTTIAVAACEIAYIAVDNRLRGGGIGGGLIQRCMDHCRNNGFFFIQTKTSNKNLYKHYLLNYDGEVISEYSCFGEIYRVIKWKV